MNYYFLLTPPNLHGSTTLANFYPSNNEKTFDELIVHALYSDGQQWVCRDLASVPYKSTVTIHDADLPQDFPKKDVFLFLHPQRQARTLEKLILNNILNSQPSYRSNVKVYSSTTAASYQGEYPQDMTMIPKPTIVSCSPMMQRGNNVTNELILINLSLLPAVKKHKIRLVNAHKEIVKEADVYTNRHNYVGLDDVLAQSQEDMLMAVADDFLGIPLYFSKTRDYRAMSIEHTHPPVEYTVFGNRNYFQKRKKSWWLSDLCQKV